MFVPKQANVGGRSLINFTMSNYWQGVDKVKSSFKNLKKQVRTKSCKQRKKQIFQTQEHLRNLMNLHGKIQQIGRWNDRVKNPCDPFAHPVLFFRTIPKNGTKSYNKTSSNMTKKQTKSNTKLVKVQDQLISVFQISLTKLKEILPNLESFSNSDIKQYTQALVSAVQQFDIRRIDQLQQLETAAIQCVPADYPPDFQSIIKLVIGQISKLL